MAASREQFSSRLGFVLAAAGSAVGIGNLVGFPVAATKGGGGAFLCLYLVFTFLVCLPVMMAELSLGRKTQKDPIGAYIQQTSPQSAWRLLGLLAFITPFMIAVFYMVITVWIFRYFVEISRGNLHELVKPDALISFVNSPEIFAYLLAVGCFVLIILACGVKDGIEKAAKLMMPLLFIMLIGLVLFVLSLDNAVIGLRYYLVPDVSKLNATVVNTALSQAFFSLSLGMGILITYGSYVSQSESITQSSTLIVLADTTVAFFAGLLILPAIFVVDPGTNPATLSDSSVTMIFNYLPKLFIELEGVIGFWGSTILAATFFLLVFIAAITSLVSIIEVPNSSLIDTFNVKRQRALLRLSVPILILSVCCICSFGMFEFLTSFTHYAGQSKSFFDLIVDLFYETILPLNGLLICLFVRYRWKDKLNLELQIGDANYQRSMLKKYLDWSLVTLIPLILFSVFLNTVFHKFWGISVF